MFKRSYLVAGVSILIVAAVACSQSLPASTSSPAPATSGTVTQQKQPDGQTSASPHPIDIIDRSNPFVDTDDNTPLAPAITLAQSQDELPTVEVVKRLTPSIVQIVTETLAMGVFNQPVPSKGVGTGIILDTNGHIMTNNHVVEGAQQITVALESGTNLTARLIGTDPTTDLAVIKVDSSELHPAILGNSSELQVGEDVIAIGHALGLPGGPTVSKGVVSALGRTIDTDALTTIVDLIQTDAEINPGNSGGALVNNHAQVVGINTAIIQSGRGIGFAINIDDAKAVVKQLMERGYVDRGFLGVTPINMSAGLADRIGIPTTEGILLARVIIGTAAAEAGLLEGDVIVKLGDESIINTGELSKFLIANPPGSTVGVEFFRNGQLRSGELTLRERPR